MPSAGLRRGGARNRRDRVIWELTARQCHSVTDATLQAWRDGLPMSRFITIAWGLAGIDAEASVSATGAFIDKAREWMRHHGHAMPWVWVQEHGDTFGQHAHILLHVPDELSDLFRPMPRRWVRSVLGGRYVARAVDTQKIRGAASAGSNAWQYEAALLGKVHYMLKCAPAQLEHELGLYGYGHKPWGQRSRVIGKRAGVFQRRMLQTGGRAIFDSASREPPLDPAVSANTVSRPRARRQ